MIPNGTQRRKLAIFLVLHSSRGSPSLLVEWARGLRKQTNEHLFSERRLRCTSTPDLFTVPLMRTSLRMRLDWMLRPLLLTGLPRFQCMCRNPRSIMARAHSDRRYVHPFLYNEIPHLDSIGVVVALQFNRYPIGHRHALRAARIRVCRVGLWYLAYHLIWVYYLLYVSVSSHRRILEWPCSETITSQCQDTCAHRAL